VDWGHVALGALALTLLAVVALRRRREFHLRIDYREDSTDDSDR
jgi:MYXO-CTERM domain-containing protein